LVRNGHLENDVIWNYSIEKSQRYYTDLVELDLEDKYSDAIKIYYAVLAAVPADTREAARSRHESWKKYLESIDIEKIKKHAEDKKKDPVKALRGLIPFAQ